MGAFTDYIKLCTLAKMDTDIVSQSESASLLGKVSAHVFTYVLGPDKHGQVQYQPPTVTPSHYYNSWFKVELRQWQMTKTAKEQAPHISNAINNIIY